MGSLTRRLSVGLVVGVAAAAFVTALVPRGDGDAPERRSRPSFAIVPPPGATGEKTFEADGYSFTYPATWAKGRDRVSEGRRFTTTFAWDAPTAISPTTSGEVLVLVVEPRPRSERDVEPYLRLLRKRLENEGEAPLEGPTRVTVGGLPAVRSAVQFLDGAVRRYTVILDRRTAYLLTCTFASKGMERGCDRVEESFRVDPRRSSRGRRSRSSGDGGEHDAAVEPIREKEACDGISC